MVKTGTVRQTAGLQGNINHEQMMKRETGYIVLLVKFAFIQYLLL